MLIVCIWFIIPLENFSLIWRRQHSDEGLQILTYARPSWPLSSEGSLACHTYYDTGHPFVIYGHLRGPVTLSPIAERLTVELSLPVFTT